MKEQGDVRGLPIVVRWMVGLGLPFIAIDLGTPFLSRSSLLFFGQPVVIAWLCLWFILSTACLSICWLLHDRYEQDTD